MVSRSILPLFAMCLTLSGCNGDNSNSNLPLSHNDSGIELPVRIRDSFAIDQNQVIGRITIDGQSRPMSRVDGRYQVVIPNLAINSSIVIQIEFSEQMPDGRILTLARSNEQNVPTGTVDRAITFTQNEFSYSFDDDNDQVSNIIEREQGTDPFVSQNTINRSVVIQFDIPSRINQPDITRITALVAGTPRPHSAPIAELGYRVSVTGLVSSIIPVEIKITLEQVYDGSPVPIAIATDNQEAGEQRLDVTLTDADFDFSQDTLLDIDGDGISNLDELQSGTNPFVAN